MSATSPVPALILILSVVGAVQDWRYVRAGGKRSSWKEIVGFWIIVAVITAATAVTEMTGFDPYGILGYVLLPIALALFGVWALGRFRTRRRFPVATGQQRTGN